MSNDYSSLVSTIWNDAHVLRDQRKPWTESFN